MLLYIYSYMHIVSVFLKEKLNGNEEEEDSQDNPYMEQRPNLTMCENFF